MDEGLNTFSTARALEQFFGPHYYSEALLRRLHPVGLQGPAAEPRRPTATGWPATALAPTRDAPVDADVALLAGHGDVAITYNKTALWLHTLERMLGWDTLQRILSTYYAR